MAVMDELRSDQALQKIIQPLSTQEFLSSYWRKTHCDVRGSCEKFSRLLQWDRLNRILEQQRFDPGRLRLVQAGTTISPDEYIDYQERSGLRLPRISVKRLNREIRKGATLVVNEVHSLYEPLTVLAEDLERFFGVPVGINAYAGFASSPGLEPHRDEHEVFILQIAGNKRWQLYGKSDPSAALESTHVPNIVWDEVLRQGDLLYVPRGCWHLAVPIDEPSLHLTISIHNPTLADIMAWVVEELHQSEIGQRDIPRIGDLAEKEQFTKVATSTILSLLSSDTLDRYFRYQDSVRRSLTHVSLPWSVVSPRTLPGDEFCYRLTGRRALNLDNAQGTNEIGFSYGQALWRLPVSMRPLLEILQDGQCHPLSELVDRSGEGFDEATIRIFVSMLLAEGLIVAVPKSAAGSSTQDS